MTFTTDSELERLKQECEAAELLNSDACAVSRRCDKALSDYMLTTATGSFDRAKVEALLKASHEAGAAFGVTVRAWMIALDKESARRHLLREGKP